MNYISEIKAFYDWLECNPLDATHISLWHGLMSIANKTGWREEFTVPMSTLELKTGIKRTNLYKARNKLQQAGLISFREREGRQSAIYKILSLCTPDEHKSDTPVTNERQMSDTPVTREYTINKLNKTKLNNDIPPLSPTGEKADEKTVEADNKNPKDELNQIFKDGCAGFTESLKQAVKDWIAYKAEKQDKYKSTGLKNLLAEIANSVKTYGETAVIEVITQSMAANYKGIVFSKLKNNYNSQPNPQTVQGNSVYHSQDQAPNPGAIQANGELTEEDLYYLNKDVEETPYEKKMRELEEKFNVKAKV